MSSSSSSFQATASDHQHFGGDAVVVLIREPLTDLVETKDLATVSQLEACLAGQVIVANQTLGSFTPADRQPARLRRLEQPVRAADARQARPGRVRTRHVPEPGRRRRQPADRSRCSARPTSRCKRYEQAAYQLALAKHLSPKQASAAATAAGQLAYQQQIQQLEQLAVQSGLSGIPRIDDPTFIRQIVFDPTRGVNQPKARFSLPVPDRGVGADPGAAEAGTVVGSAGERDQLDPAGRQDADVPAGLRRELHRQRSPGRRQRPGRRRSPGRSQRCWWRRCW